MADSLLDQALGYARVRLELVEDSPRKRSLRERLDVLDGASRTLALEETDVDSLVFLVRLAIDLRDEIAHA